MSIDALLLSAFRRGAISCVFRTTFCRSVAYVLNSNNGKHEMYAAISDIRYGTHSEILTVEIGLLLSHISWTIPRYTL